MGNKLSYCGCTVMTSLILATSKPSMGNVGFLKKKIEIKFFLKVKIFWLKKKL